MSLALFRSTLRSAVREAQACDALAADPSPHPRSRSPEAELLRRVARGELSAEDAVARLRDAP